MGAVEVDGDSEMGPLSLWRSTTVAEGLTMAIAVVAADIADVRRRGGRF